MEQFCGSKLWDTNITWETEDPDFTECFQKSVLSWIPCFILWLLTPLDLYINLNSKQKQPKLPWTPLNLVKLMTLIALALLPLSEIIYQGFQYKAGRFVFTVDFFTPSIIFLSYVLIVILFLVARKRGKQASGVVFIFWLLMAIAEAAKFQSLLRKIYSKAYFPEYNEAYYRLMTSTLSTTFVLAELLLFCFSDKAPRKEIQQKDCPLLYAGFLSKITFWWFNGMAYLGFKKPLSKDDMWRVTPDLRTEELCSQFEKRWKPAVQKSLRTGKQINIVYPMLRTFYPGLLYSSLMKLLGSLMTFANPLILNYIIDFMSSNDPAWRGFLYAALMFAASLLESMFNNQYEYSINLVAIKMHNCLMSVIYKKTLHLSNSAKRKYTVGEISNLMAVDTQRILEFLPVANYVWSAPLQIAVSAYLLWQQLGISTLGGLSIIVLLIPLNAVVTLKLRTLQVQLMKLKDQRLKIMNEVLSGIKLLKLYAWEPIFQREVVDLRDQEVDRLRKQAYLSVCISFAFTAAPFLIGLASFTMFVLIDPKNILTPNVAFVSLSLFNIIRVPMGLLPIMISFFVMAMVSFHRISAYMNGADIDTKAITRQEREEAIHVNKASFSWGKEEAPTLHNLSLSVPRGSLVAVVGQVGAGKSSLLSALLGDMEKLSGTVNINGSLAYMSQQAWIQNATLRDNILFSQPYLTSKYNKVVEACALAPDLEILPGGDQTEIGEKGINLSGGQKQRVSMARAVYSNADIYLLDDPLSAVDSHVGKHLFEQVIGPNGLLKNKTRILVTHRISFLPHVDTIFVLQNGILTESGSYTELLNKKGAFSDFLIQYLTSEAVEEEMEEDSSLVEEIVAKVATSPEIKRQLSRLSAVGDDLSLLSSSSELRKRKSSGFGPEGDKRFSKSLLKEKAEKEATLGTKLIEVEAAQVGSVKWSVYMGYFRACSYWACLLTIVGLALSHSFNLYENLWLSMWSNDAQDPKLANDPAERDYRLGIYGVLGAGETLFVLVSILSLNLSAIRGSKVLHDSMLSCILHAPMAFFDTTPVGRILNRFSKDIDTLDVTIAFNIRLSLINIFRTLVAFIIISIESPLFLVAAIPLFGIYYFVQKLYISTSRQLKRLESITRSPIYTHFSETVSGVSTIRAYSAADKFLQESERRIDVYASCFFPSIGAARWLAVRLEFLGYCIIFFSALFAVLARGTLGPGLAALSITSALTVTMNLNMLVRCNADVETNIVSAERTLEYTSVESEAPWENDSAKPHSTWPDEGEVDFDRYATRYREGLPLVLNNITASIKPGEKVGIVGRTGAGKSSLTLCLFRLVEAADGRILIDGINIANLGLHDLRSKLTIIPQDPVLFTGSMRFNLDPYDRYSDHEIWHALELSHLKAFVQSLALGLNHVVTEGGENLSVGQRQLVCLARALLRKSKVLLLDEATAAVDMETDDLIQVTIREQFKECTILTIAHRLNTIMDYDRVLVLDKGQIVEFDSPANLLAQENSTFFSMAKDAGLV